VATTPEGRVKAAVKAFLKTLPNCWWFMPVSNGMGAMGVPDFIVCYKGVFIAIETKAPGREASVTPLQERNLTAINQAFGFAIVASDVKHVETVIRAVDAALAHRLNPAASQQVLTVMQKMAA
jgi:hypothetical protein